MKKIDNRETVFVIMPFSSTETHAGDEWTNIFEKIFKPTITECGYNREKAIVGTGSLSKTIVEKLKDSAIVLADLTDKNSNVFHELGVRHALSKGTIIISQTRDDIPSDLVGYWSLEYGTDPEKIMKFKKELKRIISEIKENPYKSDSPVSDYLDHESDQWQLKFDETKYYMDGSKARSDDDLLSEQDRVKLLSQYEKTEEGGSYKNTEEWLNSKRSFIQKEICQGRWIKMTNYPNPKHLILKCCPDGTLKEWELFNLNNYWYGSWNLVGSVLRLNIGGYQLDIFASRNISNMHFGIEIFKEEPKTPCSYFIVTHVL